MPDGRLGARGARAGRNAGARRRDPAGHHRDEDGDRGDRALHRTAYRPDRTEGGRHRVERPGGGVDPAAGRRPRTRRPCTRRPGARRARWRRRIGLGPGAGRGRRAPGAGGPTPGTRLARTRRGAPARSRQAHLPRADRAAARRGQFPRSGQPGRICVLRRRGRGGRLHTGQSCRRLGPDRRAHQRGLCRRLHLARRPCRRRHRGQERLPRPAVDRTARALAAPARRFIGRGQRGGDGAPSSTRPRLAAPRRAWARSRPAGRA